MLAGNISGIRRAGRAALRASLLTALAFDAGAQADPRDMAQAARQAMAEQRFGKAAEIYTELAGRFPNEPALLANLGMALHFSGQHAEAIEPLQQAAQSMPASFPAHFALGASLSRLGRKSIPAIRMPTSCWERRWRRSASTPSRQRPGAHSAGLTPQTRSPTPAWSVATRNWQRPLSTSCDNSIPSPRTCCEFLAEQGLPPASTRARCTCSAAR